MRGIIGRKVGMTQLFLDSGKSIPATVIEIQPNVVTNVLTNDKNGYEALQLSAFEKREKSTTKPLKGHFAKAKTTPKRFVCEIRNMQGFSLGDKIEGSIFKSGELVDITGISKGHGFQGNIKRHNQKIGPKSHGGGGGSQPIRQVGSLGDMVSNRVFKGMTMPGHMGVEKVTVQNLEVVAFDNETNSLIVRGSVPGAKKNFVIIRDAVKGLKTKSPIKLVNVKESEEKNHLFEESKKYGVELHAEMSLEEMHNLINEAKDKYLKEKEEQKAAKQHNEINVEHKNEELQEGGK